MVILTNPNLFNCNWSLGKLYFRYRRALRIQHLGSDPRGYYNHAWFPVGITPSDVWLFSDYTKVKCQIIWSLPYKKLGYLLFLQSWFFQCYLENWDWISNTCSTNCLAFFFMLILLLIYTIPVQNRVFRQREWPPQSSPTDIIIDWLVSSDNTIL